MNLSRHAWLASALLAACASQATWEKPGVTEATLKDDSQQCRVQASLAPSPQQYAPAPTGSATVTTGILSRQEQLAVNEAEQFQKCMTGKGYSLKR
jgi:hypothetical protein